MSTLRLSTQLQSHHEMDWPLSVYNTGFAEGRVVAVALHEMLIVIADPNLNCCT